MKSQHIIDNEEWGNLCGRLTGLIDELCSHEISKNDFYNSLKLEVEEYRKKSVV